MKKLIPFFILSLFAFVACDDDDDKSIAISDKVVEFIQNKYSGADIRHAEYDGNGLIEVEIIHDSRMKDVYFNSAEEWVYTSWDVRHDEVPAIVKESLVAAYPDFILDDVDFIERNEMSYYEVELEKGGAEIVAVDTSSNKTWRKARVLMVGPACLNTHVGDIILFPNDKGLPSGEVEYIQQTGQEQNVVSVAKNGIFLSEHRIFATLSNIS